MSLNNENLNNSNENQDNDSYNGVEEVSIENNDNKIGTFSDKGYIKLSNDVNLHLELVGNNKARYIFKENGEEFSNLKGNKPSTITATSQLGKEIIEQLSRNISDKKAVKEEFNEVKRKANKILEKKKEELAKKRNEDASKLIAEKNMLQNGKRRYLQDKENCRVILQKKVCPEGICVWQHEEDILTIVPLRIDTYKNLETKEVYLRFKYLEKGKEKKKDFRDFDDLKSFIKRDGKNLGMSNSWAEYLSLLKDKGTKKEFYPKGIVYANGKYLYIDENEEPITNPEYHFKKIKKAKKQLKHHEKISNIKDKKKFRTIIKWGLVSKCFSPLKYDTSRNEEDIIPYILLTGEPHTAKSTNLATCISIYNENVKSAQSVATKYTLMTALGESKNPLIIDEAFSLLNNPANRNNMYNDTFKKNVTIGDEIGARGNKDQQTNKYRGKRICGFTMNDKPGITDSGFIRRIIELHFNKEDIVTEKNKADYKELKKDNYVDNLKELFFYLHMKIIAELNNTQNGFYECVDKVLIDEGLNEYTNVYWVKDTKEITTNEEKLIEDEMYDFIHSELSRNPTNNNDLIKDGYIQGLKEKDGKYYVTKVFIDWYNNKSHRFKTSLSKLARILNQEVQNKRFNRNQTSCVEIELNHDEIELKTNNNEKKAEQTLSSF